MQNDQSTPTSGTPVDFYTQDEMELGEHPRIKGLPRHRPDMGTTLMEGDQERYPWLRARDHVERLSRLISLNFGLVRLLAGWVPNCPSYDLKTALPERIYEDMRHLVRLRDRFHHLPGSRGSIEPTDELKEFLNRLGRADDHHCFLSAFYFDVKRALLNALEVYLLECDPIYDAPTIYELKGIIPELRQQIEWAKGVLLESRLDTKIADHVEKWRNYVWELLASIGSIFGEEVRPNRPLPESPAVSPMRPAPEKFLGDPRMNYMDHFPVDRSEDPFHMTLREIVYHNATEWGVIDHLYCLFFGARGMPLEFYLDLSRHTWDEARHSLMGMRRLRQMGFDPFRDFKWPYFPTRKDDPVDFFGQLTMIAEACSFTRKRGSIEPFYRFKDPLSAQQSEIDCVDERLHVAFGSKWLPSIAKGAGDLRPMPEIIRSMREKTVFSRTAVRGYFSDNMKQEERFDQMTKDEKLDLAHVASSFCNIIEFSLDFTVY
jgi:hypothetical protein